MIRRVTWYKQPMGSEEIVEGDVITLDQAIYLVAYLRITPRDVEIGESVGFQAGDGSFVEFLRLGLDEYQVRYEDPGRKEYRIGVLPFWKAKEILVGYFTGRRSSWLNELEPY